MRPADLFDTFADFINGLTEDDFDDFDSVAFAHIQAQVFEMVKQFADMPDDDSDEDLLYAVDELWDILIDISPTGYFGGSEGDGSDYGFWSSYKELESVKIYYNEQKVWAYMYDGCDDAPCATEFRLFDKPKSNKNAYRQALKLRDELIADYGLDVDDIVIEEGEGYGN